MKQIISFLTSQIYHSLAWTIFYAAQPNISLVALGDILPCLVEYFIGCHGRYFTVPGRIFHWLPWAIFYGAQQNISLVALGDILCCPAEYFICCPGRYFTVPGRILTGGYHLYDKL